MDDGGYWDWRDRLLAHPHGRATGGEECVQCGAEVPPNAHWKNRDRHVCSPRCNSALSRRFNRLLKSGRLPEEKPLPRPNPRTRPIPTHFAEKEPDEGDVAVEFDGYYPLPGDSLERHGQRILYCWYPASDFSKVPDFAPHGFYAAIHVASGCLTSSIADEYGNPTSIRYARASRDGSRLTSDRFEHDGVRLEWRQETIRDIAASGREYTWTADIVVPTGTPPQGKYWTAAYTRRSEEMRRISASTARHQRRLRIESGGSERIDPRAIYDRDNWECGLCRRQIDKSLSWPDPMSASLDHVVPLAAGGGHTNGNVQAAHWICNVRKGARQ